MRNLETIIWLVILAVVMFALGFVAGSYIATLKHQQERPQRPVGYTVLDSERVINQNGDTVRYQWNKFKK